MTPAIVALLALIFGTEVARIVQVHIVDQRAGRAFAAAPQPPTAADVVEAARSLPTPSTMLDRLIKHRYIVTLRGDGGSFGGVLTEADLITTAGGDTDMVLVLEQCATLPGHDGETPSDIAGRVILAMSGIAYMQQLG